MKWLFLVLFGFVCSYLLFPPNRAGSQEAAAAHTSIWSRATTFFSSSVQDAPAISNKFAFTLWPAVIVPFNTTLNITLQRQVFVYNADSRSHTIHWFNIPVGSINPCQASAPCTIVGGQSIQMTPFSHTGNYWFEDQTNGMTAVLITVP